MQIDISVHKKQWLNYQGDARTRTEIHISAFENDSTWKIQEHVE